MGTTTNFGFAYPESADAADVPADIKGLAEDVDDTLLDLGGTALPRGIVGEDFPTNASTTTSEAFRGTITASLKAGRKYLVRYWGQLQGNTAGALVTLRLRYASGSSVTTSGTLIQAMGQHIQVADKNAAVALGKSFSVSSDGTYTVGVSVAVGSGTVKLDYSDNLVEPYLVLTDEGEA